MQVIPILFLHYSYTSIPTQQEREKNNQSYEIKGLKLNGRATDLIRRSKIDTCKFFKFFQSKKIPRLKKPRNFLDLSMKYNLFNFLHFCFQPVFIPLRIDLLRDVVNGMPYNIFYGILVNPRNGNSKWIDVPRYRCTSGIIDLLPYLIVLVAVTYCIGHIVEKIKKK